VLSVFVDVIPRKSANVKSEFTLTIPSKAIMWMLVVVSFRRDMSDIAGDMAVVVEANGGRNIAM
jgi:hypothetical protein